MGDLIIKPEAGGSIKLQNNAGTNTLVSDNSGNVTLAGSVTIAGSTTIASGTISGGTLASAVTFPAGHVVQTESFTTSTYATASATGVAIDDTIPQNTEGFEVMSLAITPKSASNYLIITASISGSSASDGNPAIGLFQDSIADAIAYWQYCNSATNPNRISGYSIEHKEPCASTNARTYKIHLCGPSNCAYYFLGGQSSGRKYGGAAKGTIIIREVQE